jgi:hypothetical protein
MTATKQELCNPYLAALSHAQSLSMATGSVWVQHNDGRGNIATYVRMQVPEAHGNRLAREGVDRCPCGAKYWEHDRCVSCGDKFVPEKR